MDTDHSLYPRRTLLFAPLGRAGPDQAWFPLVDGPITDFGHADCSQFSTPAAIEDRVQLARIICNAYDFNQQLDAELETWRGPLVWTMGANTLRQDAINFDALVERLDASTPLVLFFPKGVQAPPLETTQFAQWLQALNALVLVYQSQVEGQTAGEVDWVGTVNQALLQVLNLARQPEPPVLEGVLHAQITLEDPGPDVTAFLRTQEVQSFWTTSVRLSAFGLTLLVAGLYLNSLGRPRARPPGRRGPPSQSKRRVLR